MTLAERTCTVKYVLAESSRWLLHRRRDTKKMDIPGCRKKKKKKKKKKKGCNDIMNFTDTWPGHAP